MNRKHFSNGPFAIEPNTTYRVAAAETIYNEDWKTALAHKQREIKMGEMGTLLEVVDNFYGSYAVVQFDDVSFRVYAKFTKLDMMRMQKTDWGYQDSSGNVIVRELKSGWVLELDDKRIAKSKFKNAILIKAEATADRIRF